MTREIFHGIPTRKRFITSIYLCFPVPPKLTIAPVRKVQLTIGQNYTLNCTTTGDPQPSIIWTRDGVPVNQFNGTGYQLRLFNVKREDAGSYRCTASNGYGSDATSVSIVSVQCKRYYLTSFFGVHISTTF